MDGRLGATKTAKHCPDPTAAVLLLGHPHFSCLAGLQRLNGGGLSHAAGWLAG
jgi:hypothetical protein